MEENQNNNDLDYFNDNKSGNADITQNSNQPQDNEQQSESDKIDINYFNSGNQTDNNTKPSGEANLVKAILLSIALGALGSLVFGLLYYNGIIAFIGAFLISYLACLGYKKFNNNKLDKRGYFIVATIAIVEMIVTIVISLSIMIMFILRDGNIYVGLFETISYFPDFFSINPEFKAGVISDIVVSFIFVIIGLVSEIVKEKRNQKTSSNF